MNSADETLTHIQTVGVMIHSVLRNLAYRANVHDASKLESPEKELFDEVSGTLRSLTYGSPEYRAALDKLKPALQHHYAANSHHTEHFTGSTCDQCGNREDEPCTCGGPRTSTAGIRGMTLLDIVEMFCDWKAATLRHADGSLEKSIQINRERFGISEQLTQIFENTRKEMGW